MTLELLQAQAQNCTACRLMEGRTRVVFGEGNPDAKLMIVGEGPGEEEVEGPGAPGGGEGEEGVGPVEVKPRARHEKPRHQKEPVHERHDASFSRIRPS